ncbi:MAG: cysteine desulfurase [Pirellulales bacterium]|nr:cysteine desulfurase [Pirellulales bacterium]
MSASPRIYLDNAATSWPKPEAVYAAVDRYQRELGAPAGRGAYSEALEVERRLAALRAAIARLIGAQHGRQIVFTSNCTAALNLAIHGLLRPGDRVVTTQVEHNSVLRPLGQLEDDGAIEVERVGCDRSGVVDPDDIARALDKRTRLVVVSHASNVTGAIQPVAEIARLAHEHGALVLVDAAQTTGHLSVDVGSLGADLLASAGHKGLLGPLGTGFLYIARGLEAQIRSLQQGGTGTVSFQDRQPDTLPDKYESGNLNVPGLVGLLAGLEYVTERGIDDVAAHERGLIGRLRAALADVPGLRLFGPTSAEQTVGVLSVALGDFDPQEAAALLDTTHRIQTRAGLHCAPLMHRALGTFDAGGTLRFSVGPFNTVDQIDTAVGAMRELAAATLA